MYKDTLKQWHRFTSLKYNMSTKINLRLQFVINLYEASNLLFSNENTLPKAQ